MGSLKTISKESEEYNPHCYSMDFTMGILGLNSIQCQKKAVIFSWNKCAISPDKIITDFGRLLTYIFSQREIKCVYGGGCLKNVATRWMNIKVTIIEHLVSPVVMSFPPLSILASHYTEIKK